jgi:hypothetical protein
MSAVTWSGEYLLMSVWRDDGRGWRDEFFPVRNRVLYLLSSPADQCWVDTPRFWDLERIDAISADPWPGMAAA